MKKVSDNIESPKDKVYERMKSNLFTFLRERIPFGRDDLDEIQYDPFVQHHKLQFIKYYCSEFKISNKKIVKQWYTDIISDKGNWPIVLEAIEVQINLSDELYIKLKP